MKNLRSVRGICKTGKRPFMRLFTSDYRDGTAQLSFELQGFYFRILTYLHDGERVPADAAELARFLQCSPRTTRAFVPKLITAGKLYEANGELRNKRIDRDLEPMSGSDETELEPTSNPIEPDVELNSGRENPKPESNQDPQNHTMEISTSTAISISIPEVETVSSVELEPAALPSSADLSDRLFEACNGSLDNPVNCMGLLNVSIPTMWINQGCDLELDILPTLRAAGKKHHGKRIRSWSYFTAMVAEAKATRERGLPTVGASGAPAAGRISAARAVLEARKAREVHA